MVLTEPNGTTTDTAVAGVERLRDTAKWLIGAYASVGAAIIAGLQITSLGKVEDHARFWIAAIGAGFALVAIVVGIYFVALVLAPAEIEDADLDSAETKTRADPSLLGGQASSLSDLREKYADALIDVEEKRQAVAGAFATEGARQDARERAEQARQTSTALLVPLETIRRRLVFEKVETRFQQAKWVLGAMALVVIVCVITFAWAANPSEESQAHAKVSQHGPTLEAPSRVTVAVSKVRPSLATLRKRLGKKCDLDKVEALVVGGSGAAPEVITLPEMSCGVERFTATENIGMVLTPVSK